MNGGTTSDLVRRCYAAFRAGDRETVDALLSDDLVFTSPDDPQIDKATYFERCWPNHEHMRALDIDKVFEQGDELFVRYEVERDSGERFRNTEYMRVEDGRIKEVEVYYGALRSPSSAGSS